MPVPPWLYGTAWKEERTQSLVELALAQGFRGIDTANQRRHYFEEAVGAAIAAAIEKGIVTRGDVFLQSKFTFARGQDNRLPYDPKAPIQVQVDQSFASTLAHLGIQKLDSYLLHGPTQHSGLTADDWAAWRAMERLHAAGRAGQLGVSNVSLEQLQLLCDKTGVPPRFVQNRCYAAHGWDRSVREFCAAQGIIYQGFSLLTANRQVLASPLVAQIARQHSRTPAQVIFRFAQQIGMLLLTGTSSAQHMREDLDISGFALEPAEIEQLLKPD
jgi:diketogulonate reductase-like aldo/keto reductase